VVTVTSLPGDEVKRDRLRQKVGVQFVSYVTRHFISLFPLMNNFPLQHTSHFTLPATATGQRRLDPCEIRICPLTMDNSNRYFASAKISNPNVFHQDVRTGHSGYFASPPRSWDSSPFPPTAVTQTWEDIEGDEDVSLDAFGKLKLRLH
jgi:hypothetical protein